MFLVCGYGIQVIITRFLSPQDYGSWGVLTSVLVWFELTIISGFPKGVTKFIAESEEDEQLPVGTEHILFVDDEEFIVEIGQRMLELLGYTVVGRTDSTAALRYIQDNPEEIDMLITDYTMPKMTGIDLAKEARKIRPDLPILLCTGFNAGISEKEIKEAGIKNFVLKPVVRKELAVIVRQVLEGK